MLTTWSPLTSAGSEPVAPQWVITSTKPFAMCAADATGNGVVNIDDLVLVITHWGATGSDPADVNGDHVVNIDDLVAVITAWGNCP